MKKILSAGLLFLATTFAYGQGVKVGVVNVGALLELAPQAQAASASLEKEFEPKQRALIESKKSIDQKKADLDKNRLAMKETKVKLIEREIQTETRELQRKNNDLQELLNLRRNEELARIQDLINKSIRFVGKQEGFDLILYEGIAYTSEKIDLTDAVLKYLQELHEKQPSEFNQATPIAQ